MEMGFQHGAGTLFRFIDLCLTEITTAREQRALHNAANKVLIDEGTAL